MHGGARSDADGKEAGSWRGLLLEAEQLLPDHIGPSIIVLHAALERMAGEAILGAARRAFPYPEAAEDLFRRTDGNGRAGLSRLLDIWLRALTGRSLKEEGNFWRALRSIRSARNRYIHEGLASTTSENRPLTVKGAASLIQASREIVDFVERATEQPPSQSASEGQAP